jgi:hypothetical protein
MKKLFCVVLTDLEGLSESPYIYHIKADSKHQAEERAMLDMIENFDGHPEDVIEIIESFDLFSFPVEDADIIEA